MTDAYVPETAYYVEFCWPAPTSGEPPTGTASIERTWEDWETLLTVDLPADDFIGTAPCEPHPIYVQLARACLSHRAGRDVDEATALRFVSRPAQGLRWTATEVDRFLAAAVQPALFDS